MLTTSLFDHLSTSQRTSIGVLFALEDVAKRKKTAERPPQPASSGSTVKARPGTTVLINGDKELTDKLDHAQRMVYPIDKTEETFSLNQFANCLRSAIEQTNSYLSVVQTYKDELAKHQAKLTTLASKSKKPDEPTQPEIMRLLDFLYNKENKHTYEVQAAAFILLMKKLKSESNLYELIGKIAFESVFSVSYDENNGAHFITLLQLKEHIIAMVKKLNADKNIKAVYKALQKKAPAAATRADTETYFSEALETNDEQMIMNHVHAILKTCKTLEELRKKMVVVLNKIDVFNLSIIRRITYEYMSAGAAISISARSLNVYGLIFQAQINFAIETENFDSFIWLLKNPDNEKYKSNLQFDLKNLKEKPFVYQAFLNAIYEAYPFSSTVEAVSAASRSNDRKTIQVFSLDYDGCLATKLLLSRLTYISDTDIVLANREFFKKLIQLMESADESILISGSNRQSPGMDDYNSKKKNVVSSFVTLPAILDYLKRNRPGLKISFSDYLLLDSLESKPHGTSIHEAPQSGNDPEHSKFPLLYAQMHKIAHENPNADIVFNFFDDLDDNIIRPLIRFFSLNKALIPKNVRLNLNHYEGDAITLLGSIQGEGDTNPEYEETLRSIYKYFKHGEKDSDNLITIKTIVESSGILSFLFADDKQLKGWGLKKSDQDNVIADLSSILNQKIRVRDDMVAQVDLTKAQAANSSSTIVNPARVSSTMVGSSAASVAREIMNNAADAAFTTKELTYGN